jgi:hypothetical protein
VARSTRRRIEPARLALGVDPGRTGALAAFVPDTDFAWGAVIDTKEPEQIRAAYADLSDAFALAFPGKTINDVETQVFIEDVYSRPGEGHVGVFSFGRAKGTPHGWLACLVGDDCVSFISPQAWQSMFFDGRLHGIDKDARKELIRLAAKVRWPTAPLSRIKDESVAAALYIAACGASRVW